MDYWAIFQKSSNSKIALKAVVRCSNVPPYAVFAATGNYMLITATQMTHFQATTEKTQALPAGNDDSLHPDYAKLVVQKTEYRSKNTGTKTLIMALTTASFDKPRPNPTGDKQTSSAIRKNN